MTRQEKTARAKRIQRAIKTIKETEKELWDVLGWDRRGEIRGAIRPLEFAAEYYKKA